MTTSLRSKPTCQLHLENLEDRLVPSAVAGNYASGVWQWQANVGWNHISFSQASQLQVDDAGDVFGKFASGLWRWQASTNSWTELTTTPVQQFQVTGGGALYGDFGSVGLWRCDTNGNWQKLSALDADKIAVNDKDVLYCSFLGTDQGTWKYDNNGFLVKWQFLTSNAPDVLKTDEQSDMVGVYKTYIAASQQGTWRWNPTNGWARLSSSVPNDLQVADTGDIYENRGIYGIYHTGPEGTVMQQVSSTDASASIIAALPDGSLFQDLYYTGATHHTGWYYNVATEMPALVASNLDTVSAMVAGKDGDLFLDANSLGLLRWSPTNPLTMTTLGGQDPTLISSQEDH
jgi:hypothetical protein